MRRALIKRLIVGVLCFAVMYTLITHTWRYEILDWIIRAGRAAGCDVASLGRIVWGPDGPFFGEGAKVRFFNSLARNGVVQLGAVCGFAAAVLSYTICAREERWWPRGRRGPTRCGRCRHTLAGLREPRCPECGLVI